MSCHLKEKYGPVRLDWGMMPIAASNDLGGCPSGVADAPTADAQDHARVAHYKRNMEQRGGNNPYQFEQCPERLRYEVGTGCMNPGCMCKNCHGDCKCTKQGGLVEGFSLLGRDLKFWLVAAVVAFIVYKYLNGKKRR